MSPENAYWQSPAGSDDEGVDGGDVNGDFVGVPTSQLAVFPGTTHFFGLSRTTLVLDSTATFLDAPHADS